MAFAAPRRWRTPEPGQLTDAWVSNGDAFNAADAAAIAELERTVHDLRVAELASREPAAWRQKAVQPTGGTISVPWQTQQLSVAPPSVRHRKKPEWNKSVHTRSRSFASQVAAADVADRNRKEAFKLRRLDTSSAGSSFYGHQRDHDNRLSRPKPNRGVRHTRMPSRKQRRWSDPQIKISPARINDAHHRTLDEHRKQSQAEVRIKEQARRFRKWEQQAGQGRGMAGRDAVGEWRTIRSKEERLRALEDVSGAEVALEHGLHGAFGGYEFHCVSDAEAMHLLRNKLARERTRALELEAQLWEERQREWELEKAIEHSVHAAYERVANNGWGTPPMPGYMGRHMLW